MADGAFTKSSAQHGLWDAALVDMKDDDEIMKKLMMPVAVGLLMLGPADHQASASTLGFGALADLSDLFGELNPLASFGNFVGATETTLAFSHRTSATSDHFSVPRMMLATVPSGTPTDLAWSSPNSRGHLRCFRSTLLPVARVR